jgi:hypothetical protein
MSTYIESELEKIIATIRENENISSEYKFKYHRLYLSIAEVQELLQIIQRCKQYESLHAGAAS